MDLNSSRHRSVSQSSLQSTHDTREGISNASRRQSPSQPRRPFKSLNDTSLLLRSSGPLESMLKTTTETGDLGIYSINIPSPNTRHHPSRSRGSHGRRKRRNARNRYYDSNDSDTRDIHKSLPSHRDPTSEILSLYGGPQITYSRSYSPASEGQRSHSLTTCSSSRVPSYKSSGTFNSQRSYSGLQRPRSPFPYPARLKRPGVRPSSPAVTDDGLIDYKRMVEIDRSGHRTTSGSYMTRGHRTYRRYPPLSLRPDFSKSTSSLPMRSSSAPYCGPGVDSPGASGDIVQSPYTSTYRHFVAGDQSARSASLTSIVEMYQGKSPGGLKQPIRSPCSFYYDYTEEFERGIAGKVGHGPVAYSPQGRSLDLFRDHAMKDGSIEPDYQGKDKKNHERLLGTD